MHTLLIRASACELISRVVPTGVVSLVIAEMFYKFHSFTLEAVAFLGTWYVLEYLARAVTGRAALRPRGHRL